MNINIVPIGRISVQENKYSIQLKEEFRNGLNETEGFSHLVIIWWAHLTDTPDTRKRMLAKNLFRLAPDKVGVFSSRTPERPNPIMISVIKIESIDIETGTVSTPFIDAEDGTPVLDIKPYFPMERIRDCKTPSYYSHWPQWAEDSPAFDWKAEIRLDDL